MSQNNYSEGTKIFDPFPALWNQWLEVATKDSTNEDLAKFFFKAGIDLARKYDF